MITQVPITVSLPISTVVVPRNGIQVIVPINISSTSEFALVTVSGLPAGVEEKYAASDTNPSGSLAFTASTASPVGTYTPRVTVSSAGQTASLNFTLVVSTDTSTQQNRRKLNQNVPDSLRETLRPCSAKAFAENCRSLIEGQHDEAAPARMESCLSNLQVR
jgi:hypothetical protein